MADIEVEELLETLTQDEKISLLSGTSVHLTIYQCLLSYYEQESTFGIPKPSTNMAFQHFEPQTDPTVFAEHDSLMALLRHVSLAGK